GGAGGGGRARSTRPRAPRKASKNPCRSMSRAASQSCSQACTNWAKEPHDRADGTTKGIRKGRAPTAMGAPSPYSARDTPSWWQKRAPDGLRRAQARQRGRVASVVTGGPSLLSRTPGPLAEAQQAPPDADHIPGAQG